MAFSNLISHSSTRDGLWTTLSSSSSDLDGSLDSGLEKSGSQLLRRPTHVLHPRSPLSRLTSRAREGDPDFKHPLTHEKTNANVIVSFDRPDDPYRPINWTQKKKFISVLLYGLTTMGTTWASSMRVSCIP
jgi:hypothetical protein